VLGVVVPCVGTDDRGSQGSVETIDSFTGLLEWYDFQRQRAETLRRQRELSLEEQVSRHCKLLPL